MANDNKISIDVTVNSNTEQQINNYVKHLIAYVIQ